MKETLDKIISKLSPVLSVLSKYKLFTFFMILLLLYGFVVFRINVLNNKVPSDSDVSAKLQNVGSPHLDQSVKDKIQQLQDNSVEVQSLFNSARNNPFNE